jgi:DAPG hydrolase-like protein
MRLDEVMPLLHAAPLKLEMGYERLEDGVLHVACRTDLHRCTGEMFEWWFRFRPDTQKYVWWHPGDHVSSAWTECQENTHIGSVHLVEERLAELPAQRLAIQFCDATEFFEPAAYAEARRSGQVSGAVCGRIGFSHAPARTPSGVVLGGRVLHVARDTGWGCALRSHFFLGYDFARSGRTPSEVAMTCPDPLGGALLQHCYNEFTFLSRFLPSLYVAENRDRIKVDLPW